MKINEAKDYDKRGIVMVADGMFQLLSFQEGSRKVYLCHTETTQIYQVATPIVGWTQHIHANTFLP